MRVLLVDPRAGDIRRRLGVAFGPAQAVIDHALDVEDALELGWSRTHDLIVLADGDALATLRRLRTTGCTTPVIWLADVSTAADRVRALDLGADDCVEAAIDDAELLARARHVVRRTGGHASALIRVGDMEIDTAARTVTLAGRRLRLTGKEFGILELLALKKGAVVSRETLMDHLYGGPEEPVAKVIDIHVCRIRRKLSEVASGRAALRTVWGLGFALSAPAAAHGPAPLAA